MQLYFAKTKIGDEFLTLSNSDKNHLIIVLRHKIGDEIIVAYKQQKYLTKINTIQPDLSCKIITKIDNSAELTVKVTLVVALLKEQKFDFVIQKAVELGVNQIVPIQLSRSVSNVSTQKQEQKQERWQKIAKAAAQQAKRNIIPQIMPITYQISDLKPYLSDYNYIAYENTNSKQDWVKQIRSNQTVTALVGPEGGISEKEINQLKALSFSEISLGPSILRAETAPLYIMAIINYQTNFGGKK